MAARVDWMPFSSRSSKTGAKACGDEPGRWRLLEQGGARWLRERDKASVRAKVFLYVNGKLTPMQTFLRRDRRMSIIGRRGTVPVPRGIL